MAANKFPDISKNIDGNLGDLAKDLFKNHIFFNSTSMKSQGIVKAILSYYPNTTGAELGTKLVQACKRVKEQCTNKRSKFTDVVRKSTAAILVDPKYSRGEGENDWNGENISNEILDSYNRAIIKAGKRMSKGGYILGKFILC